MQHAMIRGCASLKTCFFIGHRDAPESVYARLQAAVERHITEYGVTDFVVGRYGNFDHLAARAVIEAKQRHPEVTLTLLLPYYRARTEPLPDGFDGSLFPDGLEAVPKRAAILRANRYMLHHCEYMIVYDAGRIGNTRKLVSVARKVGGLHLDNIALPYA